MRLTARRARPEPEPKSTKVEVGGREGEREEREWRMELTPGRVTSP